MEQVDIAIYRATLLASVRRKVAESGGKSLRKGEIEAIVRAEWQRMAKALGSGEESESPDFVRKLVEGR